MQDSLFSARASAAPVEPVQGVSRVVDYIRRIISGNRTLSGIRVRGEVSGLTSSKEGRLYFDLKENNDILKCVAWASAAAKLPPVKNGDEVICGGDYGIYPARSVYQLAIKTLEHTGIGALYAEFERLKERFRGEGLFESARKRPMPVFPRRLAVVSARGKGAEDFLTTIAKRAPFIAVEFVETRVQGDGAQIDVAEAIDKAAKLRPDAIVLTRGGGSYEDLFPFNLEPVVRAIVRSRVPVLSAIGHTGDVHLSDLVADHACETPSNAAQYFGEIADRYAGRVRQLSGALDGALRAVLIACAQRRDYAEATLQRCAAGYVRNRERDLQAAVRRLDAQTPQRRLTLRAQKLTALRSRLDAVSARLASAPADRLRHALRRLGATRSTALRTPRHTLELLTTRLGAADPDSPLERGYAIVRFNGRAVRDAGMVPAGAQIAAQVRHGTLVARVERAE